MYLSHIIVENFRILENLDLRLGRGLTLIVGENDSGKSALLDAIRLVLGTQSFDPSRLTVDDFHVAEDGRARELRITCEFSDFTTEEAGPFLEWAQIDGDPPVYSLQVTLEARWKDLSELRGRMDREVSVWLKAGVGDAAAPMDGPARDALRATYLKALRDAEQELAAKRGSRLSQILMAHPLLKSQKETGLQPEGEGAEAGQESQTPKLVDIVKGANEQIMAHDVIKTTVDSLNTKYLTQFTLGNDSVKGAITMADPELRRILEQLQLILADTDLMTSNTRHGLGMNNLLFMATELLLLESEKAGALPLALIEEPEAHLHPQLQIRLMDVLQSSDMAQVIVTSHSPNLASLVDLQRLVLMNKGKAFHLAPECTKLDASDYRFLRRFLDVTKANLFFARGVAIVEGDAENILLPVLGQLIGRPFSKYGISVVNVGHVGFFRYSRIFQRKTGPDMDVKVACIGDRDIPPNAAKTYLKKTSKGADRPTEADYSPEELTKRLEKRRAKYDGGPVKLFVSDWWTFEYDLARSGLATEMHQAIHLSLASSDGEGLDIAERDKVIERADAELAEWRKQGLSDEDVWAKVYQPLYAGDASKPETAQYLSEILTKKYGGSEDLAAALRSKLPPYLLTALDYLTGDAGKEDKGERADAQ